MDFKEQKEWFSKHPGIYYDISYARGTITIWKETAMGSVVKSKTYSLTPEELNRALRKRTPILEKYHNQFIHEEEV